MLEALGISGIEFTAGSILAIVFLMVMRGLLMPRRFYDDAVIQRDKWEAAFWKLQESNALKDAQNIELLETAKAMKHFMAAFPKAIRPGEEER